MRIAEIKDLMERGEYNRVLTVIESLKPEDELKGIILHGRILERKGELIKATRIAEEAYRQCKKRGTEYQKLRALLNLGYAHPAQRNQAELVKVLREAKETFRKVEFDSQDDLKECQASLAHLEGYQEFLNGSVESSINRLKTSLQIREKLYSQWDIVETLTALGFVHIEATGNKKSAIEHLSRGLSISEKLGNSTAIAHSLNRLGVYYTETNDYDRAFSFLKRSLELYQGLENPHWVAGLSSNIAWIYRSQEKYDLALEYFVKALNYNEKLGAKRGIAINLSNIAWLFTFKGDPKKAISYHQKCLDIRKEIGEKAFHC